ncbi:MAG TPA: hypothetical protein VF156_07880, partial [Agromyces sp.]
GVNADAVALAVLAYSYSTESVNGVAGANMPGGLNLPAPAGPEGTFVDESAGGLDPDLIHDHDHHHGPTETE